MNLILYSPNDLKLVDYAYVSFCSDSYLNMEIQTINSIHSKIAQTTQVENEVPRLMKQLKKTNSWKMSLNQLKLPESITIAISGMKIVASLKRGFHGCRKLQYGKIHVANHSIKIGYTRSQTIFVVFIVVLEAIYSTSHSFYRCIETFDNRSR